MASQLDAAGMLLARWCAEPLAGDRAAELARVFKALADPVRLRLLSLIASHAGGEACVCELTGEFDVSQPTISHHLKVLREAGCSTSERRGTWVYYRLLPGPWPPCRSCSTHRPDRGPRDRPGTVAATGRRVGRYGPAGHGRGRVPASPPTGSPPTTSACSSWRTHRDRVRTGGPDPGVRSGLRCALQPGRVAGRLVARPPAGPACPGVTGRLHGCAGPRCGRRRGAGQPDVRGPAGELSTTERTGGHLWLGEVVATAGLVLLIFALARTGRGPLAAPPSAPTSARRTGSPPPPASPTPR